MGKIKHFLRKFIHNTKELLGIQGYSDYFKRYFDSDNATSSVVVSIIVILLEVFMIGYILYDMFLGSKSRSFTWIVQHLSAYIFLLLNSIVLLIHSENYLNGKNTNRNHGKFIRILFTIGCLAFGIYISYLDYAKGEQILTFISMEIFLFGILFWRPIVALLLTTSSFLIFYILCESTVGTNFATQLNLFTVYLGIIVSSVLRFQQKFLEAKKAEHIADMNTYLGEIAVTDETTGIGNMLSFRNRVDEIKSTDQEDYLSRIFLFVNVTNFASFNERYGFDIGSQLLNTIAHSLHYAFSGDPVAHFSDDHFVIFTNRETILENGEEKFAFMKKIETIQNKITSDETDVKMSFKVGAYIPEDINCNTTTACDFARYACSSISKKFDINYCEYSTASAQDFARKQYIINNIDKAISEGYIHIYYQPVVLSKNRELCGFEALARWIDPIYGFIPPYIFINVLEEYRQIHKLDAYVVKKVCKDILKAPEHNIPALPVSINFSRLDFELMDIVKLLEENVEKQGIDKSLIHVEVTESALSQDNTKLRNDLNRLKEKNYSLWLDDFGSGYSGLNILKEYEFDMMKIDMAFLMNFSTTPKSRPILKNIVMMANDIGMHTLTEGVETEEAFEFLREIGCERIQGYLFGKPMSRKELLERIRNNEFMIPKK